MPLSLSKALSKAFKKVYPFDGRNVPYRTINGKSRSIFSGAQFYSNSLFIQITSFFGLPNRMRKDRRPTVLNIIGNFVIFPDYNSPWWRWVFLPLGFVALPFNLLSALLSTMVHTLMLFTELFPLTLAIYMEDKIKDLSNVLHFFSYLGRGITSPITNFESILANKKFDKIDKILLITLLNIWTGAVYAILFPYAAQLFVTYAMPFLSTQFPGVITFMTDLFVKIYSSLPYLMQNVMQGAATFLSDLFSSLGANSILFTESFLSVWAGTALATATLLPVITAIDWALNYVLNKFFTKSRQVGFFAELPSESTDDLLREDTEHLKSIGQSFNKSGRRLISKLGHGESSSESASDEKPKRTFGAMEKGAAKLFGKKHKKHDGEAAHAAATHRK